MVTDTLHQLSFEASGVSYSLSSIEFVFAFPTGIVPGSCRKVAHRAISCLWMRDAIYRVTMTIN